MANQNVAHEHGMVTAWTCHGHDNIVTWSYRGHGMVTALPWHGRGMVMTWSCRRHGIVTGLN
eukprot:5289767-Lingulodinium_polyedra.AAC.1